MEEEPDGRPRPTDVTRVTHSPFEPNDGGAPSPETPPGAPRWVKLSAAVALAFVVLFLVLHLTGSGMGPGMHGGGH
jgi:hypothetical protein